MSGAEDGVGELDLGLLVVSGLPEGVGEGHGDVDLGDSSQSLEGFPLFVVSVGEHQFIYLITARFLLLRFQL